ncbi:AAA family ATPase [Lactobacillus sp. 23-2]|jgi:predicted kinase
MERNMRKLFLLRGAPGSGKSSFIARHHLMPYAISGDEIRLLLADLTVYYDKKTDVLHQVIPRHVTDQTKRMKDNLVEHKMSYGETVIVDGTHIVPSEIDHYKKWCEKYHYECYVVDLMQKQTLEGLLKRNQVRMQYDWVKPEVIAMMYNSYMAHPEVPDWVKGIKPNQMEHALLQRENNLDRYSHVIAIPDEVKEEDFPHVHISNFYFSFNDKFNEKYGTYRNVVTIGKTKEEVVDEFRLPYFVFKFHHKHFLISAYPIRNEMLDPIKKVKGVWSYSTGLYNVADFLQEFPENEKQHVHQFNLSKLDRTRLLHIW